MKGFWVIIITAIILSFIASQARKAKAHRVGGNLIFAPVQAVQLVCFAFLAISFGLIILGYIGPQKDRITVVSIGFLSAIFVAVVWPKAVEVSKSGVRQRAWWGGWKAIRWEQVSSCEEKRDGSMVVRAGNCRIALSPYHADRELFFKHVKEHSGGKGGGQRVPDLTI